MIRPQARSRLRRLVAALLCLCLLLGGGAALAQIENVDEEEDELFPRFGLEAEVTLDDSGQPALVNGYPFQISTASYYDNIQGRAFVFDVDIPDYPFWRDSTEYDGNLAVMSLAMALSASRPKRESDGSEDLEAVSESLGTFLTGAGFTDLRMDDYSKATSRYTVSTGIARRDMAAEGEEPFTLVAVGVCGANYKNEWQSNLSPGNGDVHEGFRGAAQLVLDRLAGYIATRRIEGRVKVWITGFSRAAAISNLLAAELTDTGMFPKEDVYAYTFATPAAVRNPPAEGYEHIYNIICPTDPVPQTAPADWGFGRYGRDLYLAVEEFSSFLGWAVTSMRAETDEALFQVENKYSPALNLRMRLTYSLLLDVLQSQDYFNRTFQPALVGIMQDKTLPNTLTTLRNLMNKQRGSGEDRRVDTDELMDYCIRVFSYSLLDTGSNASERNFASALFHLFNEHMVNSYLSNIHAIRNGLYEECTRACYVMVRGPVTVSLAFGDMPEGESVVDIDMHGRRITSEEGDYARESFYMERCGDTTIIAVPLDMDYRVTWTAERAGTVECLTAGLSVRASADYEGSASPSIRAQAGDTGVVFRVKDGEAVPSEGFEARVFSARELAEFIGIASLGINWRVALMLACALAGLLGCAALCVFAAFAPGHRRRYGFLCWLALCLLGIAALETEAAYWFFADRPLMRTIWKAVAAAALLIVFFRVHPSGKRWRDTLLPTLLLTVAADIALSVHYLAGAAVFLLCHVALVAYCQRKKPFSRGKWLQWAVVALPIAAVIACFFTPGRGVIGVAAAVYAPVLILMWFSSDGLSIRVRLGATALLASDMLLGLYFSLLNRPFVHVTFEFLFYVALLLFALVDSKPKERARR